MSSAPIKGLDLQVDLNKELLNMNFLKEMRFIETSFLLQQIWPIPSWVWARQNFAETGMYRRFSIHSRVNLSLVIPNNKMIETGNPARRCRSKKIKVNLKKIFLFFLLVFVCFNCDEIVYQGTAQLNSVYVCSSHVFFPFNKSFNLRYHNKIHTYMLTL